MNIPEGWKLVPLEPTGGMIRELSRKRWPEDFNAGKALQRFRGWDVVPPRTEYECAVGVYERTLAAAPVPPQDSKPVQKPLMWVSHHLRGSLAGKFFEVYGPEWWTAPTLYAKPVPVYTNPNTSELACKLEWERAENKRLRDELAALREELESNKTALREEMKDAFEFQQRNAGLVGLLTRTLAYYTESCFPEDLLVEVKIAIGSLKPPESGASE